MKTAWHDSLEWLYPDSMEENALTQTVPVLDVARGGFASIVLTVTGVEPGAALSAAADNAHCMIHEMVDVRVNRNTAESSFAESPTRPRSKSVTRIAPYRVFDALKPIDGELAASPAGSAALFIQFAVPANAKPGVQEITISVSDGTSVQEKKFKVKIHNVKIPASGKNSVFFTNWMDPDHWERQAGHPFGSAACWRVIDEHAALMRHARQNTFFVPLPRFFTYADGKYTLNAPLLKKYIRRFTDAGLYWIEGGHFGERIQQRDDAYFIVFGSRNSPLSEDGNRDIAQIGRALYRFIRQNNLQDRWIQHVVDEPILANGDSYRIFAGLVRKYMPGIPLLDAMSDPEIAGAPNIWCPQLHAYQRQKAVFDAVREQGDHVWTYCCCEPGGPWLNRLLDNELTRPLLLGWGCAANDIEGFLHWGWNYNLPYKTRDANGAVIYQDPFEETSPLSFLDHFENLPSGDTNIMYPGPHGTVWSSCRLEAQREGMEDWELLRMLRKKDAKRAAEVIRKVFRAFDDYSPAPCAVRAARKALLEALQA